MESSGKGPSIPERVLSSIAEDIRAGRIKPGDRLLPEREWAEELGVSRHSLRQAVKLLEALGIVEARPKIGTIVQPFDLSNIMDMAGLLLRLSNPDLTEVLEARRHLEGIMVRMASAKRSADDLVNIKTHLDVLQTSRDLDELIAEDAAFHLAISQATHNSILDALVRMVSGYLRESVRTIRVVLYSKPDVNARFTEQHIKIFEAVASGNGELASRWVNDHLLYAEVETLEQLRRMRGGNPEDAP